MNLLGISMPRGALSGSCSCRGLARASDEGPRNRMGRVRPLRLGVWEIRQELAVAASQEGCHRAVDEHHCCADGARRSPADRLSHSPRSSRRPQSSICSANSARSAVDLWTATLAWRRTGSRDRPPRARRCPVGRRHLDLVWANERSKAIVRAWKRELCRAGSARSRRAEASRTPPSP